MQKAKPLKLSTVACVKTRLSPNFISGYSVAQFLSLYRRCYDSGREKGKKKTEFFIVGIKRLIKISFSSKRAGVAVAEPQVWAPASKSPLRLVTGKIELNRRVGWMQARCARQNGVGA